MVKSAHLSRIYYISAMCSSILTLTHMSTNTGISHNFKNQLNCQVTVLTVISTNIRTPIVTNQTDLTTQHHSGPTTQGHGGQLLMSRGARLPSDRRGQFHMCHRAHQISSQGMQLVTSYGKLLQPGNVGQTNEVRGVPPCIYNRFRTIRG